MRRFEDWPVCLDAYLMERATAPFVFGEHDCCQFARGAVEAMTGINVMASVPAYKTAKRAAAVQAKLGAGLGDAVAAVLEPQGFEPIAPLMAQRGDFVVGHVVGETGTVIEAAGIVGLDGVTAYFAGDKQLVKVPLKDCFRAWRIE